MEMKIENNVLTITVPLTQGTPSKTGKTLVVASSNGFMEVPDTNIRVSLNVIKPKS